MWHISFGGKEIAWYLRSILVIPPRLYGEQQSCCKDIDRDALEPDRDRGVVAAPVGIPQGGPVMTWVPPPMNCYKVNWEAYMDSATKMWTASIL